MSTPSTSPRPPPSAAGSDTTENGREIRKCHPCPAQPAPSGPHRRGDPTAPMVATTSPISNTSSRPRTPGRRNHPGRHRTPESTALARRTSTDVVQPELWLNPPPERTCECCGQDTEHDLGNPRTNRRENEVEEEHRVGELIVAIVVERRKELVHKVSVPRVIRQDVHTRDRGRRHTGIPADLALRGTPAVIQFAPHQSAFGMHPPDEIGQRCDTRVFVGPELMGAPLAVGTDIGRLGEHETDPCSCPLKNHSNCVPSAPIRAGSVVPGPIRSGLPSTSLLLCKAFSSAPGIPETPNGPQGSEGLLYGV